MLSECGEIIDAINYLSVNNLIEINKFLIISQTPKEPIGVRDRALLESAQSRPNLNRYYSKNEDMFYLSSVLIESIILNHPFLNANKRTAYLSGLIFLLLNGYQVSIPKNARYQAIEIIEGIALKTYNRNDIENWLFQFMTPYDSRNLCLPPTIDGAIRVAIEVFPIKSKY